MSIEGGAPNGGAGGLLPNTPPANGGANTGAGNNGGGAPTLLGGGGAENNGNNGNLGWRSVLPAEYQSHSSLAHYPDLGSFVKSHLEQEKLIGRDKIVRPTEKDGKEVWDKYFESIGRPGAPNEYAFEVPSDWPQDFPIQKEGIERFQTKMHELGVPKEAGEALFREFLDYNKEMYSSASGDMEKQLAESTSQLQKSWGNNFNQNIDLAKRTVQQFDKDGQFSQYLEQSGLGNDPKVISFMHQVGTALLEDSSVHGMESATYGMTQVQAKQELDSMYADPKYSTAMFDATHPQHAEIKLKAEKLAQLAYPTAKGQG